MPCMSHQDMGSLSNQMQLQKTLRFLKIILETTAIISNTTALIYYKGKQWSYLCTNCLFNMEEKNNVLVAKRHQVCSLLFTRAFVGTILFFCRIVIKKSHNNKLNMEKYYANIRHLIYLPKEKRDSSSSLITEHKNYARVFFTYFPYVKAFSYCHHVIKVVLVFSQF